MGNSPKATFDLEERTAKFGGDVINFCKSLTQDNINKSIINQLIRSATSVGANYMEANGASSTKDFRNKMFICKKEIQETKHWIKMLSYCVTEDKKVRLRELWQETHELVLIFGKAVSTLDEKYKK